MSYCIAQAQVQLNLIYTFFLSHSADWSADAHRYGSGYDLLSDECASILFMSISFKPLVNLITQPDGTYVVPKKIIIRRKL